MFSDNISIKIISRNINILKFKLFQVGWGYVEVMFYALWLALFKKKEYCKA